GRTSLLTKVSRTKPHVACGSSCKSRRTSSALNAALAFMRPVHFPTSSSAECVLLVMHSEPVLAVIILRVAHDGMDVVGLLHSEFDDQARPVNPVIEGAAKIIGRTAPGEVQLVEAGLLDRFEMPLRRVRVRIAHILVDQRAQ